MQPFRPPDLSTLCTDFPVDTVDKSLPCAICIAAAPQMLWITLWTKKERLACLSFPIQSARMALIVQAVLLECLDDRLTDVGNRVGHIDADRVECLDLVGSRALAA